jgi:splicing factor 3B subunit 1
LVNCSAHRSAYLTQNAKPARPQSPLQVKTITSLSLAALAEAASPYGIESFDDVLEPLWRGIRSLRGKVLAAFLKCIGFIIPLMDAEHAFYYTREVMVVLKREFQTPDEEMKKIVLKVRGQGGRRELWIRC